ncbi:MAG TPA: WecB/TagA/CpsF family glycosyltransferase [Candidatus Dormibacteraeota bacterium]|nr:WecB/TagA/CpsF family glycosyltransferase [Candidatus Dormibacteraeota bacterium]
MPSSTAGPAIAIAATGRADRSRLDILGAAVDLCTKQEALLRCERALAAGAAAEPVQIVTLNPEMVMQARRNVELGEVLEAAELVVPDGAGVAWAARRMGTPLPERIPGVELLVDICSLAARRGWSVYLLGASPGVAEQAAAQLQYLCAGLLVAGCASGSYSEADAPATVTAIRASGARLIAVAFGVPHQDLWLGRHLTDTGCAVGIGVGGSLDYLSGRVRRAPLFLRRLGLEWSFRLLRQPWRLPRMVRGAPFFLLVWQQSRKVKD